MRFSPLAVIIVPSFAWAADIPLTSDVSAVTLYPQGATVTRQVPFTAPAGQNDLILTDLPRNTDLAGIRVAVDGAQMGSLTTRRDFVPPQDDKTDSAIQAAKAEVERREAGLREAEADIDLIRLEREAAEARVAFLTQIGQGKGVAQLDVTALRDLTQMIGVETLEAKRTALQAEQRAKAAERGLKDLKTALKQARQALAALVPEAKARAMLAIGITSDVATDGQVTVTYTISDAGWRPVYDLRLDRGAGQLAIERGAFVTQETGENWQDVALTLSTVRPSAQNSPSEIWPWLRRIVKEQTPLPIPLSQPLRMESAQADSSGFAGAARAKRTEAEAMFDGLSVTYSYPDPVTIAAGADHLRIDLGTLDMSADLVAQAVPLSDENAYLMANVTNDTGELILPSSEANFYLDGRFLGQRDMELIASGAEADLSFGPIEGLRLTRTVLGREEGDKGVISRSSEQTETVRIDVENLTGESWPLRLLDRIPYSEQTDLRIEWSATPEPSEINVDGKRGVLAWEFDLPAGDETSITLKQSLRWPDGMLLR